MCETWSNEVHPLLQTVFASACEEESVVEGNNKEYMARRNSNEDRLAESILHCFPGLLGSHRSEAVETGSLTLCNRSLPSAYSSFFGASRKREAHEVGESGQAAALGDWLKPAHVDI
jgi:hypothetical protein